MSGDIFGSHAWRVVPGMGGGLGGSVQHSPAHKRAHHTKKSLVTNVNSIEVEKS